MDIRMPHIDGLAATELARGRSAAPEIVILTTFDADEHVMRALRADASGFLLKDTPPADIVDAVRRVADGDPMLAPRSPVDSSVRSLHWTLMTAAIGAPMLTRASTH
jgi:DNA-binding NarL/FixJ family response regulator